MFTRRRAPSSRKKTSRPSQTRRRPTAISSSGVDMEYTAGSQRTYASQGTAADRESPFRYYEHLGHLPRADEALKMLKKIASLVKPLMRKRGWRVEALSEFLPTDSRLLGLNINKTDRICIRLRYNARSPSEAPTNLYAMEAVLDTLLHELSHIVHGPHDGPFMKLWNELRDEMTTLQLRGYTGESFLGTGKTVGHGGRGRPTSGRLPLQELQRQARANARANADARRKAGQAALDRQNGPRRTAGKALGGAHVDYGRNLREIMADAADRRRTITQGCVNGLDASEAMQVTHELEQQAVRNGFRTKAEEDEANDLAIQQAIYELWEEEERRKIERDEDPQPPNANPHAEPAAGPSTTRPTNAEIQTSIAATGAPPIIPFHSKPNLTQRGISVDDAIEIPDSFIADEMDFTSDDAEPDAVVADGWSCTVCTLQNPQQFLCCEVCGSERPSNGNTPQSNTPTPTATPNLTKPTTTASTSAPSRFARPKNPLERTAQSLQRAGLSTKPQPRKTGSLGWTCGQCRSFMEHQWWTCTRCGAMKTSS